MAKTKEKIRSKVKEQYENYPYPPPLESLEDVVSGRTFEGGFPCRFFHFYWPFKKETHKLDILIAGCGASQAASYAITHPEANITAIDISQTSLDCTKALLDKYKLTNVALHKLEIENVANLNKQFDLIVSSGVLHHLPSPEEGLKALRDVLKKDGSMSIMLYGKYGRDAIYYVQDLMRKLGITTQGLTDEKVALVKNIVANLPQTHPMHFRTFSKLPLTDPRRLRSAILEEGLVQHSDIVDLFLHPQDKAYTIEDVYQLLEASGCVMQKLLRKAHYHPQCSSLAHEPVYQRIKELPEHEQFAIGELYNASLPKHEFIVCRDDRPKETYEISFESENWKEMIPMIKYNINTSFQNLREGSHVRISSLLHQYGDISIELDQAKATLLGLVNDEHTIAQIEQKSGITSLGDTTKIDNYLKNFFISMNNFDYLHFRKEPL